MEFTRKELWKIEQRAVKFATTKGTNEFKVRAYWKLAEAANVLDAYIARSEVK